jgi:dTDP-4-dehydrorhamnose reductase
MRILLTGKNGQLGWELHRQLEQDYNVLAVGHEDIGFLDTKFLSSVIRRLPHLDMIVNAAAYTDIDRAEREPFVAETINSEAAAILAAEATHRGIPMIHFSTDHVFGGQHRTHPYREGDRPNPVSLYGKTKLDGELRIRSILEKHLIFRLSGLYGIRGKNFFTSILHRNRNGIVPRAASDQMISPNWTPLIAEAVADAISQLFWGEPIPWGT